ncbi:hypothetical protein [Gelatiniphilus marinus]|uniref:Uncharacterized protein n=1 Tax=Gelatiniphilus marinus TaxID=1759464 RepID=A0ABW5JX77_9FLAO
MQTQNIKIFNNDLDLDVTHKINTIELDNWINHLKYIKKELTNLVNLCNTELSLKLKNDKVLKRLEKKEVENETLLNALNRYVVSRAHIRECEDTQCDMVYITEHESYRKSYLYHLNKYRRFKNDFLKKSTRLVYA